MNVEQVTKLRRLPQAGRRVQRSSNTLVKQALKVNTTANSTTFSSALTEHRGPVKILGGREVVKAFKKDEVEAGEAQVKAGLIDGSVMDGPAVEGHGVDAGQGRAPLLAARRPPGAAPAVRRALRLRRQNLVYVLAARRQANGGW